MAAVRMTVAVAKVLRALLESPAQPRDGYELMRATGFRSGKVYPILAKLQAVGSLSKEREDIDPSVVGRPARRMYWLSPEEERVAREELTALSKEPRPIAPPRIPTHAAMEQAWASAADHLPHPTSSTHIRHAARRMLGSLSVD